MEDKKFIESIKRHTFNDTDPQRFLSLTEMERIDPQEYFKED